MAIVVISIAFTVFFLMAVPLAWYEAYKDHPEYEKWWHWRRKNVS